MCSSTAKCPICLENIPGGESSLQAHVNNHLDAKEEELSQKLAAEMSAEPPVAPPTDLSAEVANGDIGDIEPEERIMEEVERNDAVLAAALAESEGARVYGGGVARPTLMGSLADSADQLYPDVLRKVIPQFDGFDILPGKKVHICTKVDLYSSNLAGLGWDCGYRNIQMLFSSLFYDMECGSFLKTAGITEVPSIPEIAGRIEEAWKRGYDPEGAASFGGTLTDKEVWIGATEVYVLFSSININTKVMDFETPTVQDKRNMFEWIYQYFDSACQGRVCSMHQKSILSNPRYGLVPPLFCQWQGHSVTIIGAEKARSGDISLIVLDPSRGFYTLMRSAFQANESMFRRETSHAQLEHPRFQIVSLLPRRGRQPDVTNGPPARRGILNSLGRLKPGRTS